MPLIVFKSRSCLIGEYYSNDYTCISCTFGKSTIEPRGKDRKGEPCGECLEFAVCDGPKTYPQPGFMRPTQDSFVFVKCFNEEACLVGDDEMPLTNCADGYDGVMCTSCEDGYWKDLGGYVCYECRLGTSPFVFGAKVLFFAFYCYWISRLINRSFANQNQESIAVMRIFLTMFQMIAILNRMESMNTRYSGDGDLQWLLDNLLYYILPENWLMDFDCLLVGLEPQEKFFTKLMVTIFLPAILLLINVLMIFILTFCVKLCHF